MVLFRRRESRWNALGAAARAGGLKRVHLWQWIALTILGAVLLYYLSIPIVGPHYAQVCRKGEYGPPDECAYWDAVSASILRVGIWLDDHNGLVSASAGLMVAAFTFVLWRSTEKLWTASEKQHGLARDDFIATHRPKIVGRGFYMFGVEDNAKTAIIYRLANNGANSAKIVSIEYYASVLDDRDGGYTSGQVVHDSPVMPIKIDSGFSEQCRAVWDVNLRHFNAAHSAAELRVTVGYVDEVGRRRESSFHREWDFMAKRFSRIDGSEFEYAD